MTDWTEKYRPTTLSEVRGNNSARDDLKEWAETWDDHREAVIIYGSPGVGKTSAAHALANDMGWPVIELNASDQRTGDIIDRVAGEAAKSSTLTQAKEGEPGRRLVVMDEADNIHGTYDRGGARAVTSIVKEASQPMVLIANEFYDMSRGLRNACQTIEFRDVSARSIVPVLRDLCRKEEIEFDEDALERIAEQNSGDLRGAVKDLQAVADGRDAISVEDVTSGERDTTKGIFEFLDSVLKEDDPEAALYLTYDVDETPDDLLLWAEDKVPKVYDAGELARAYDYLARADRWLGRVRATQNYSYWRYATDNIAAGVAAARNETRGGWTRYGGAPYRSSKDTTRDEVATQIARVAGVSTATARRDIVPFLAVMTHHCKNRDLTVRMAARYEFGTSEVAFVTGSGESTNKVQSVVDDAEELRAEAAEAHGGDVFMERVEDAAAESESAQAESGSVETVDEDVLAEEEPDEEPTEPDDDSQSGLSDFM
ncbi:replication factor C large subunit [Halosegnis rubeus]|jgi:replication factor C large subunit|uniref:Replication factor C large subunit n=1 Tax=Halosegnis rubeus TaxID=2212850 RepID=A0A5N5UKU2_9EURY|nr:replication factor C large subunit [Halosegnis rubeus]KAB7518266.1 replication factor C large subunit [Halosegnis rubeus]KAB7519155.1 replication factor C large subunit [Halosegnis rubeus]